MRKPGHHRFRFMALSAGLCFLMAALTACSQVSVPGARNADIPAPTMASQRAEAVNERPDSVLYLPLGSDVLVPEAQNFSRMPNTTVGPFELRSETLAGALQLIMADYEIPLAFETEEGLNRTITVANLSGPMDQVIGRVCGLADLYCAYEEGVLVVKDTQTFTVSIPPVGEGDDFINAIATGLEAITGASPITETGTRTIIYEATNRTANLAKRYFQRLRANTALIVFEVYIWEVSLNSDNNTGIDWQTIDTFGKFNFGFNLPGGASATSATPVSIGLPTTGDIAFGADDVLQFISTYGAVKTISQPQLTVLSGSQATLRAADTINYVSSLTRTVDNDDVTTATETDTVDTGFTLTIGSAWDNATIYGNIEIELQEFRGFQPFDTEGAQLRLPETTERELTTQVRMRPGDSLLMAGFLRESDQFDTSGPGFNKPFFPTSRAAAVTNTELVFLLKPRVIVYTSEDGGRDVPAQNNSRVVSSTASGLTQAPLEREDEFPMGTLSKDALNPGAAF